MKYGSNRRQKKYLFQRKVSNERPPLFSSLTPIGKILWLLCSMHMVLLSKAALLLVRLRFVHTRYCITHQPAQNSIPNQCGYHVWVASLIWGAVSLLGGKILRINWVIGFIWGAVFKTRQYGLTPLSPNSRAHFSEYPTGIFFIAPHISLTTEMNRNTLLPSRKIAPQMNLPTYSILGHLLPTSQYSGLNKVVTLLHTYNLKTFTPSLIKITIKKWFFFHFSDQKLSEK